MKTKSFMLILAFLIFTFGLISCQKNETIKIGFTGTLSGVNSDLGISGRNGAILAARTINEAGGINGKMLEIIVKDDKNNQERALEVDRQFYDEGVVAIVGHMTSGMADLTVPYVNEQKILMISPTISADFLSNMNDYFLRMIPSNSLQAAAISKAMSMENVKKAAIIFDSTNSTFTEGLKNRFKEKFIKASGTIVYEKAFTPEKEDYMGIVNEMIDSGAEGVFIIGAADSAALFAQTLYKQGKQMDIFLPSWAMTSELLDHGGKAIEAANMVNFYDNQSNTPEYLAFKKEYVASYGMEPSFAAQFSYEAILVLASAIEHSETTTADTLKKQIIQNVEFNGLQGTLSFNKFGDIRREDYIYKVQDGAFAVISDGGIR